MIKRIAFEPQQEMDSPLQHILDLLSVITIEGKTTIEIDRFASNLLRAFGCQSAFLGYKGFPNVMCISVNNEVIHGIPGDYEIQEGDIVKLDIGLIKNGIYDDGAKTVLVGQCSAVTRKLARATKEALEAGIKVACAGKTTHDIAQAIETIAKRECFSIIQGYSGHGIGKSLHMHPEVPNQVPFKLLGEDWNEAEQPVLLESGMRICIEPMFSSGMGFTQIDSSNGWTVKLGGGGIAAHEERSVLIR